MSDSSLPPMPEGTIVLHSGPLTPTAMTEMTGILGPDAVIDTDAARLAGASFAFGAPAALDALKDRLAPTARAEAHAAHPDLPEGAADWLATGEQGLSSKAIFARLTGHPLAGLSGRTATDHPHDAADLRRCRLLLDAVPAFAARLSEMADVSAPWARLVAQWDDLCAIHDAEWPDWRTSPVGSGRKTYARIRQILDD